jgi:hypothetical protein
VELDQPQYVPPPPPQHVPPNVQRMAEVHQLGALTTAYTKASSKVFVISSLILVVFFLFPLCILLSSLSNLITYASESLLVLCLFICIFAFAAISFICFRYRYRQVYLYMEGLVYCTWHNIGVLRWRDIKQLSWRTRGTVSLRVYKTDGAHVTFWLTFPTRECAVIYAAIENEFARVCAERSSGGGEEYDHA